MKKIFSFLVLLLTCAGFEARATHALGGELAYRCIGPNAYRVKYTVYKNGLATVPPGNTTLTIKSPGCNTGRTITLLPVGYQPGTVYGPAVLYGDFTQNGNWAHTFQIYTGVVTFTAAEQSCTDWYLNASYDTRPMVANIAPSGFGIGNATEAFLKLGANLNNNSPEFDQAGIALPVVPPYQDAQVSMGAIDLDGDSLVYSLQAPLMATNQPFTHYATFNPGGQQFFMNPNPPAPYNTTTNPQLGSWVALLPNYTPTFPLISIKANWNAVNPATGVPFQIVPVLPYFNLDSLDGTLIFNPTYYVPDTVVAHEKNIYAVSIKVDEYRKINGVPVKIGSVRRETLIGVGSITQNRLPYLATPQINGSSPGPGFSWNTFRLMPGTPFSFQIPSFDVDPNDVISMVSNADSLLPGATVSISAGSHPTFTLNWTPTAAQVRSQPYYLRIRLMDNSAPLASVRTFTFPLRVGNTGGVTGTKKDISANTGFVAFPNPFSQEVSFKLNAQSGQQIYIYNTLGQLIDQLQVNRAGAGQQIIRWENAAKFAAGTYVAKLIGGDQRVQTLKFTKLP